MPKEPRVPARKATPRKKPYDRPEPQGNESLPERRQEAELNKGFPDGVTVERINDENLEIKKIDTSKDLIEQPRLAADKRKIIPSRGASIIINGKSGSGKTTLLTNLITCPQFFGKSPEKPDGWFDEIFMFSPTADGDDIQQALGIKKEHVYTDLEEGPELISVILNAQKEKLAGGGKAHKAPQYAVIFDDVIGETSFMNSKEFLQTFYMVRHRNCTTFICSQHYKRIPKVCRQQASFIFFFAGSAAEVETVVEDYAPPFYTKKEFKALVQEATRGDHSFLTICMKVGWDLRFRKNLSEFIKLDRLQADEEGETEEKKEPSAKKRKSTDEKEADSNKQISVDRSKDFHRNLGDLVKFFKSKHEQNEQTNQRLGGGKN
jgi:hypothetical protein